MQPATQKNYYEEADINLSDFFNKLIASKKLIIATILFFTILATFIGLSRPPVFTSTALIEIGQYMNLNNERDQKILIEKQEDLLRELNIDFVYKEQSGNVFGELIFSK